GCAAVALRPLRPGRALRTGSALRALGPLRPRIALRPLSTGCSLRTGCPLRPSSPPRQLARLEVHLQKRMIDHLFRADAVSRQETRRRVTRAAKSDEQRQIADQVPPDMRPNV